MRRLQPDGVCACCGRVGPVQQDVERTGDGFVTVEAERAELPPLCPKCNDAQRRWDAARSCERNPRLSYPYTQGPPKSPPVRR